MNAAEQMITEIVGFIYELVPIEVEYTKSRGYAVLSYEKKREQHRKYLVQ